MGLGPQCQRVLPASSMEADAGTPACQKRSSCQVLMGRRCDPPCKPSQRARLPCNRFAAANALLLPTLCCCPIPGLGKIAALRGTGRDVNTDERTAVGHEVVTGSSYDILKLIYPACYPVYEPTGALCVDIIVYDMYMAYLASNRGILGLGSLHRCCSIMCHVSRPAVECPCL